MGRLNPLLRLAAISGVETAIAFHIIRGDDLDARDSSGLTPLILAAARKNSRAVRLLLDAGANPTLVDPKGMDALAHALQINCPETVEILSRTFNTPLLDLVEKNEAVAENGKRISFYPNELSDDHVSESESYTLGETLPTSAEYYISSTILSPSLNEIIPLISDTDSLSLDPFSWDAGFEEDWITEIDPVIPVGDQHVAEAIKNVHKAIGQHKVVDSDEDWEDIDIYLPSAKSILDNRGVGDTSRIILLTAIRNGIVSEESLIELCLKPDGSRNEEVEKLLGIAIGEFGAVVENIINDTSFYGFDEPSIEEKLMLDEAIEFIKDLASDHNEPFRFYSKDIRYKLLDSKEEIVLSQEMERAWQDVLSVLARWPEGLTELFNCAEKVFRGEAEASVFSNGPDLPMEDETTGLGDLYDEGGEEKEHDAASEFVAAIAAVQSKIGDFQQTKEALDAVKLTRGFFFELVARYKDDFTAKGLIDALKRQSDARERMIHCNLRLALSIAKKHQWSGVAMNDLVQEANIGLIKAVERYDWRKGFRFSTYATWWIRQQITRSIANKSRNVRAPVHVQNMAWKIIRERNDIELERGYPERDIDTAIRLGIPLSKMWTLQSIFDEAMSLDEFDSNMGCARVDLLEDQDVLTPARFAEQSSLFSTLSGMLEELDERSRSVIMYRFGLGGIDAMTLEEVGQIFGVTRERIRQIELKAMCKLSSDKKKQILAPFINKDNYQ